jgi:hypothetical protein
MWIRYTYGTNKEPVLAGMQIMFGEPRVETSHLQDLRIEVRIFHFILEDVS